MNGIFFFCLCSDLLTSTTEKSVGVGVGIPSSTLHLTHSSQIHTMPPPTLTLKQRLANLANAANTPSAQLSSSSPSSPLFDNTNTTRSGSSLSLPSTGTRSVSSPFSFQQQQSSRRKPLPFFNHSWSRNASHQGAIAIDGIEETRRVEEVLSKIIFQAGVDYEYVLYVILSLFSCACSYSWYLNGLVFFFLTPIDSVCFVV